MPELKRVEIPENAKASLRVLLTQKQQAEQLIGIYVRALRDSLNIEGEGWTLELENMVFIQQAPSNGEGDADVVGAIASNPARE